MSDREIEAEIVFADVCIVVKPRRRLCNLEGRIEKHVTCAKVANPIEHDVYGDDEAMEFVRSIFTVISMYSWQPVPEQCMEHSDDSRSSLTCLAVKTYDDKRLVLNSTWCNLSSWATVK